MKSLGLFKRWEAVLALILVVEILFFGAINPAFLNVSTLLYSTSDFIHVGIVALALTLVIITGGIDLSIGAVMGLSAITLGLLWVAGVNIWVACFCAVGAGAITGIINSVAIQIAQVNPLVITLGSSFLFSVPRSCSPVWAVHPGMKAFPVLTTALSSWPIWKSWGCRSRWLSSLWQRLSLWCCCIGPALGATSI